MKKFFISEKHQNLPIFNIIFYPQLPIFRITPSLKSLHTNDILFRLYFCNRYQEWRYWFLKLYTLRTFVEIESRRRNGPHGTNKRIHNETFYSVNDIG